MRIGILLALSMAATSAMATPPAEEVVTLSQKAVNGEASNGFAFSEASWNAPASFPIARAVVLYANMYGSTFGAAVFAPYAGTAGTCQLDESKLSDIQDSFDEYLLSGDIKSLLTDDEAIAAQLAMIEDAVTSQTTFAANDDFSVSISGNYLVTTGVVPVATSTNQAPSVVPEPLDWDEATQVAAADIATANLDKQFHPITALDDEFFTQNVDELESRLTGYTGLVVDPVFVVWGNNGSRLLSRVTVADKYMIVDTAIGMAYGPYVAASQSDEPFVGDAMLSYPASQGESLVAVVRLVPCNTPPWNSPAVTPRPATWPPVVWPTLPPVPGTPPVYDWQCQVEGSSCRCQIRSVVPNCKCGGLFNLFCDDCVEVIECIWSPGQGTPGQPTTCGGNGLASPPAPGSFCNEYWRYE